MTGDLRPELIADAARLGARFRAARPFPHLVLDGLLEPSFLAAIQADFPDFDPVRARNELGEVGGKAVHPHIAELGAAYVRFDRLMQSRAFLDWLSHAAAIPNLLYDPAYIGGGTHQNMNGQALDMHVDFNYHPESKLHRRLNLILFLNDEWSPEWGGCLQLGLAEESVAVTPAPNRCVIFETSEVSWHGFGAVAMPEDHAHLGRRTLAVYFYTKDRPPAETAPAHSTIYIPRPLPDRFAAGYTLDDHDEWELKTLLARRDQQIRFLYDREMEFGRMAASPTFRLARALAWPARALKKWLA
ncbi:MAG: 2OG-Fe(II) oxygenase [Bryobacteraceae bacterium]